MFDSSPASPPARGDDASRRRMAGPCAGLADLVDAAVEHRGVAARHDAQRLSHVFAVLEFAAGHAESFVTARFSGAPARDLARRAAIAELAVALRMTERRVDRLASDAAVLCRSLPAVFDGMRNGELDYEQAKAVIDAVEPLADQPEVVAALDEQLADLARTVNPARLRRAARRLVERVQADTIAARHAQARAERRIELHAARDGMAWLHLLLPAADALLIKNRLCQAADRCLRAAESSTSGLDSEQRVDQLRADLARDLLLHGVPPEPAPSEPVPGELVPGEPVPGELVPGEPVPREPVLPRETLPLDAAATRAALSGVRPTVHVTVPVLTLLGRTDEPGMLDGYGPIDPETARTLAGQAPSFTRLLTHPVTAAVLDVDRASYRVPADLRKWLQIRDQTCRFPGCSRPAIGCDLDHSEDWTGEHGATAHDNLAHLCTAHHHLKHDTAWSLRHLEGGVLEWTSLTGVRYRTIPEGQISATSPPGAPVSEASSGPPPF